MKHLPLLLAMAAAVPVSISTAQAAERPEGLYIAPSLSYVFNDEDYNLDDGVGASIALGHRYDSPWAAEFALLYAESNFDNNVTSSDGDHYQARLDALYHIELDGEFTPYIVAGLGYGSWESDSRGDADQTQVNAGLGIMHMLTDQVAFRSDLRAVFDIDEDELNGLFNIGISYFFDKPTKAVPMTKMKEKVIPAPRPMLVDGDKDGIPDASDRCPNTGLGVSVSSDGCPLDSDNDGVYDSSDRCAATPVGAKVDEKGCRIKLAETVKLSMQLNFKSGSNDIQPEHASEIAKVGKFLKQYPDSAVVIEGHTDSQGSAAFNQQLSEKRAASVREFIIKNYNIASSRISSLGIGEVNPIADNSTASGRAQNRRVVAVVKATVLK